MYASSRASDFGVWPENQGGCPFLRGSSAGSDARPPATRAGTAARYPRQCADSEQSAIGYQKPETIAARRLFRQRQHDRGGHLGHLDRNCIGPVHGWSGGERFLILRSSRSPPALRKGHRARQRQQDYCGERQPLVRHQSWHHPKLSLPRAVSRQCVREEPSLVGHHHSRNRRSATSSANC